MVTLMTFTFYEKEESIGVIDLETADASTDGVIGLDVGEEVSNKFAISDVRLDLEIDE